MLFNSRFVAALTAFACLAKVTGQSATSCYSSLTDIDEDERLVTDIEVNRTYILCADTTFLTGFLTNDGDILGGDKPLTLRKNMRILCGETGSSANNCVITRGSFLLTSLVANYDPPTVNTGVVVQGVTFDNAALFGIYIELPGEFQFIDCIYTNMRAEEAAIVLEWDGGSIGSVGGGNSSRMLQAPNTAGRYRYTPARGHEKSKQDKQKEEEEEDGEEERDLQTATTLKVEFIDCVFANNSCVTSRLGLVIIALDGVDITFLRCKFDNNDFAVTGVNDVESYGVIIEIYDRGRLTIMKSCFTNNKAYGNALVTYYGDEIGTLRNNYGLGNTVEWAGNPLECTFASLVNGTGNYPNLECSEFDAATCLSDAAPTSNSTAPVPTATMEPVTPSNSTAPVPTATMEPVTPSTPGPAQTGMPSAPAQSATPVPAVSPAPVAQPPEPVQIWTLPPASSASPNMRFAPLIAAMAIIAIVA